MSQTGTEQVRLTDSVNIRFKPVISPDGQHIAFISGIEQAREGIYLINIDGTDFHQLLGNEFAPFGEVVWSPDGKKLVFATDRSESPGVFALNMETAELIQLAKGGANPVFSPDGTRIAFTSSAYSTEEMPPGVFTMTAHGNNQQRITLDDKSYYNPVWLPDGEHLLCLAATGDKAEIYEIDVNSLEQRQVTRELGVYGQLVVSPNYQYVAFTSQADTNAIFLISIDGLDVTQLTQPGGFYSNPSWSPDGSTLAFSALLYSTSATADNFEIYTISIDGSDLVNLSNNSTDDLLPVWQP